MRNAIPALSEIFASMQPALEQACKNVEKRTKTELARIDLANDSGAAQNVEFKQLKDVLANSVSLSYPREAHSICLFTDASGKNWSAILLHVRKERWMTR